MENKNVWQVKYTLDLADTVEALNVVAENYSKAYLLAVVILPFEAIILEVKEN